MLLGDIITCHWDLVALPQRVLSSALLAFYVLVWKLGKFYILISVSEVKPLIFGQFIIPLKALVSRCLKCLVALRTLPYLFVSSVHFLLLGCLIHIMYPLVALSQALGHRVE